MQQAKHFDSAFINKPIEWLNSNESHDRKVVMWQKISVIALIWGKKKPKKKKKAESGDKLWDLGAHGR